jgi:hypothetical protein
MLRFHRGVQAALVGSGSVVISSLVVLGEFHVDDQRRGKSNLQGNSLGTPNPTRSDNAASALHRMLHIFSTKNGAYNVD